MPETYKDAGVDIAAGEAAVEAIKSMVRSTYRPEVIGDIGGFGGLFAFPQHRFTNPVLVSSTDGVGTKALIAQAVGRFDTIGIDLVAMCVDDLVCQGAEPLFILDYIAVGKLDPNHIKQLVRGVVQGCQEAGCARDLGTVGHEARAPARAEHRPQGRLLLRGGLLRGRRTAARGRDQLRALGLDRQLEASSTLTIAKRAPTPAGFVFVTRTRTERTGKRSMSASATAWASASIKLKLRLAETSRTQAATSR